MQFLGYNKFLGILKLSSAVHQMHHAMSSSQDNQMPTTIKHTFSISKDLLLRHLNSGLLEVQATIAQLIHEDDNVTVVIMSLFLDVVERHLVDEIRIVATGLSSIIRRNWDFAKKFHSHGVVSTLRRFTLLQGCKAPQATVTSCVELLFQLLVVIDEPMAVMDEGAWMDIASQVRMVTNTYSWNKFSKL